MWRTWYRYKKKQSVQSEPFEYVFQLKSNSKRRKKKVHMLCLAVLQEWLGEFKINFLQLLQVIQACILKYYLHKLLNNSEYYIHFYRSLALFFLFIITSRRASSSSLLSIFNFLFFFTQWYLPHTTVLFYTKSPKKNMQVMSMF